MIILKRVLKKQCGKVWTAFVWLRLGFHGGGGGLVNKIIILRLPKQREIS
jgi:hypothetical protein